MECKESGDCSIFKPFYENGFTVCSIPDLCYEYKTLQEHYESTRSDLETFSVNVLRAMELKDEEIDLRDKEICDLHVKLMKETELRKIAEFELYRCRHDNVY